MTSEAVVDEIQSFILYGSRETSQKSFEFLVLRAIEFIPDSSSVAVERINRVIDGFDSQKHLEEYKHDIFTSGESQKKLNAWTSLIYILSAAKRAEAEENCDVPFAIAETFENLGVSQCSVIRVYINDILPKLLNS